VEIGDIIEHRYQPNKMGIIINLKPVTNKLYKKKYDLWDAFIEWTDGTSSWISLTYIKPYSNE